MNPLEMIKEWKKGCTCAGPYYDKMLGNPEGTTSPWECKECTEGLINAIEEYLKKEQGNT